jgi:hypothetical protein
MEKKEGKGYNISVRVVCLVGYIILVNINI